jgi:hypothetical protein
MHKNNIKMGQYYSKHNNSETENYYYRYYKNATNRFATYKNWPKHHFPDPIQLSKAGFIYKGYGDSCLCFNCQLTIKDWQNTSCPWVEHYKQSPNCSYLKVCYVQDV